MEDEINYGCSCLQCTWEDFDEAELERVANEHVALNAVRESMERRQ